MPIRPESRCLYPPDWKQIRQRILARAGDKCEWCGVPNGAVGFRDPRDKSRFWDLDDPAGDSAWEHFRTDGESHKAVIRIVLTIAHLDHDPRNNDDANLAALCQRCHLRHDAPQHASNARKTRARKAGQLTLDMETV
jgi:5-methylcytosine-specific restriction endonuclease McrA